MTKALRGKVHLEILVAAIIFQSFLVVALLGGEARETKTEVYGIWGGRFTATRYEVHSPVGDFWVVAEISQQPETQKMRP